MKKTITMDLPWVYYCPYQLFAGGILTNANQSASYIRMLARDASTEADAAYYNPAGLVKLSDGFSYFIK